MSRSFLCVSALAVLAVGCGSESSVVKQEEPVPEAQPMIEVFPPSIEFPGLLATGDTLTDFFTVKNVGDADLEVSDIYIKSGPAFTILGPETSFILAVDEEKTVEVEFSPKGADANLGQAAVVSDDPDDPEVYVDFVGYGAVPDLVISPPHHDFEGVAIPCGDSQEFTLENVGSEELVITDISFESGGLMTLTDDNSYNADGEIRLLTGESRTVTVHFEATTAGSDTGKLVVVSNDPIGDEEATANGEGSYSDEASQEFEEPSQAAVDIMMLIDGSCSMEDDNQLPVENGIPPFLSELNSVADWQLIQVTKTTGCANGGIITPSTPSADTLLINNAFTSGSYSEALLGLAETALALTGPGQCNDGFVRPGSLLHIIVMSDEEDQSARGFASYLNSFASIAGDPNLVKVSAVVDTNYNCGDGTGPGGYIDAADATGGLVLNICNASWGDQMDDLATEIVAGVRSYNLDDPAVEESIEVLVNGTPTTDFSYAPGTYGITINSPPIGEADVVTIDYGVAAQCPN